jgi:hypothetical protein
LASIAPSRIDSAEIKREPRLDRRAKSVDAIPVGLLLFRRVGRTDWVRMCWGKKMGS